MDKSAIDTQSEKAIAATQKVLGLLPQIAGLVVGATAIAYYVGWNQASSYYTTLGAPWAVELLSTSQILHKSIWVSSIFAIILFVSIWQLVEGDASRKGFKRWSIGLFFLGAIAYSSNLFGQNYIPNEKIVFLSTAASILWIASSALAISELIASFSEGDGRWRRPHIIILYVVLIYGLQQAPKIMGETLAKNDLDLIRSKLPVVKSPALTNSNSAVDPWRLVSAVGGNFLLLQIPAAKGTPSFRVVDASSLENVASSSGQ